MTKHSKNIFDQIQHLFKHVLQQIYFLGPQDFWVCGDAETPMPATSRAALRSYGQLASLPHWWLRKQVYRHRQTQPVLRLRRSVSNFDQILKSSEIWLPMSDFESFLVLNTEFSDLDMLTRMASTSDEHRETANFLISSPFMFVAVHELGGCAIAIKERHSVYRYHTLHLWVIPALIRRQSEAILYSNDRCQIND